MKKIVFFILMTLIINLIMFLAMTLVAGMPNLVLFTSSLLIINYYAIKKGWHKTMWKSMVDKKPLLDEEVNII